jgi:hypothetical protein
MCGKLYLLLDIYFRVIGIFYELIGSFVLHVIISNEFEASDFVHIGLLIRMRIN